METSHFVCAKCEHNYSNQEIAGKPVCMLVIHEEQIQYDLKPSEKDGVYYVTFKDSFKILAPRLISVPTGCPMYLEHIVHNGVKEDS